jgi:hypothetical protein
VGRQADQFLASSLSVRAEPGVAAYPSTGACAAWRTRATEKLVLNLIELEIARELHPVDVIEHVAQSNDWAFERTGDDEIAISVAGNWSDYHVSFSWMEDFEALHLACAFDLKVPENRTLEVMRLLAVINEQMLFGHFDLWEQEGAIMFRHSLLLSGGAEPTSAQVEVLLNSALEACECYFQAFQFVVWSGLSARDALANVLFETYGNA